MNVTILSVRELPSFTGGGPRINQWAIADELRQRNHTVTVIWITTAITPRNQHELHALAGIRIQVHIVDSLTANPHNIARLLARTQPDVIWGLSTYTLSWASAYNRNTPRVCHIGDPEHLINATRSQYDNRSTPLTYADMVSIHIDAMADKDVYLPILADCAATTCSATHSVAWFNTQGIPTQYIPAPIVDPAFPGWRRRLADMPSNPKPRILLTGHLNGIATMSGLYYLAEDVLPHLDIDAYEWRICGGESLVPDLATRFLPYPQIQFAGYVEDIRAEMLQADINLVTTPITIGVRTRVVESLGLGACIVAHASNSVGQPELVNGENIALGATGEEIAGLIKEYAADPQARYTMGHSARDTFDRCFTARDSAGKIVDVIEGVAR